MKNADPTTLLTFQDLKLTPWTYLLRSNFMPWIILLIVVKAEKRLHFKNNNLKSVRLIIYFIFIFFLFLRAFIRMMYDAMCGCFKSHNHIRLTVGIRMT